MSDRAVSIAAGLCPDYLRSLRRQAERGEQRGLTTKALEGLAKALSTTPEWLLSGSGEESRFRAITRTLRDKLHQERCVQWSVRHENDAYFVDERLQKGEHSFGPLPSTAAARRIIESRQNQLANWFHFTKPDTYG